MSLKFCTCAPCLFPCYLVSVLVAAVLAAVLVVRVPSLGPCASPRREASNRNTRPRCDRIH